MEDDEKGQGFLVGIARLQDEDSDGVVIADLYVAPHYRRLGIASFIVRSAKCWAEQRGLSLWLHVKSDNVAARLLYQDEGL